MDTVLFRALGRVGACVALLGGCSTAPNPAPDQPATATAAATTPTADPPMTPTTTTKIPPALPPSEVLPKLGSQLAAIESDEHLKAWVEGSLRTASGVAAVTFHESSLSLQVELDPPIPAATLIDAWALARPYAVSGDVHQRSFSVHVWTADIGDPYGKRIGTDYPRFGRWEVEAKLAARPAAPLPGVSAGASPAYDLHVTTGDVVRLLIRPAE